MMKPDRPADRSNLVILILVCSILRGEGRPRAGVVNYRPGGSANDGRMAAQIRTRNDLLLAAAAANTCTAADDKCYKTSQCCPGLVCMELNFYQGFCVNGDLLQRCNTANDCPADCRCESASGVSQKWISQRRSVDSNKNTRGYCVPKTSRQQTSINDKEYAQFEKAIARLEDAAPAPALARVPAAALDSNSWPIAVVIDEQTSIPGLGDMCETSDDCRIDNATNSQSLKLCCQLIKRGRLPTKKMCDRQTNISICI